MTLVAFAGIQVDAQPAKQASGLWNDYYPAYTRAASYPTASSELVIFLPNKQEVSIQIPLHVYVPTYARSGTALYTRSTGSAGTCVYKAEFNPVRVTAVACPPGLVAFSIAVSAQEDKLLFSGRIKGGSAFECGVFEIRLPGGEMRQVLGTPVCGSSDTLADSWTSLSLSPGADRAVGIRKDQLQLIEVENGSTRPISTGFLAASWSPDGRWIAGFKKHGGNILIDASDLMRKRTIASSQLKWSPDSRYLPRLKECLFPLAVNSVGTIEALDVATGKSVVIESSRCSVEGVIGWVSSSVLKNLEPTDRSRHAP